MKALFLEIIHRGILELVVKCAGKLFDHVDIYIDENDVVQGIVLTNDRKYLEHVTSYEPKRAKP